MLNKYKDTEETEIWKNMGQMCLDSGQKKILWASISSAENMVTLPLKNLKDHEIAYVKPL